MPRAIVLGSGMVGSVMAIDLAADPAWEVCVADARAEPLEATVRKVAEQTGRQIETRLADLSDDRTFSKTVADHDIVLGALGSAIGFNALGRVIEAGKPYADISFMPEDALMQSEAARQRDVTAVVDCGVAPGLSNMMAGEAVRRLDRCDAIEIYVGGLPRQRNWPFEYKAGFSPHDVIEEYTRPSRLVESGCVVEREALSEPELMDFRASARSRRSTPTACAVSSPPSTCRT